MSLISLDGISHNFGPVAALSDVSVDVPAGAVGLIGRNGAGKSTLLKILLGILRPTHGTGSVLGLDIDRNRLDLRGRIGFMPESECLIPRMRGVDLVGLAGQLCGMPRKQALRRAHEVLSHVSLDEARYRRCGEYSVGMKQRLKLAAALVHDPPLLLLDEPTSGLDPEGRDAMLALLHSLAERHGKSLILSTHLLGDVDRVCDQVIVIDQGRVLGVGRIRDLRATRTGRYRVRWKGSPDGFLGGLRAAGAKLSETGRAHEALVDVTGSAEAWPARRLFEQAARHDVSLWGVVPEEEDLAALYHRLVSQPSREAV